MKPLLRIKSIPQEIHTNAFKSYLLEIRPTHFKDRSYAIEMYVSAGSLVRLSLIVFFDTTIHWRHSQAAMLHHTSLFILERYISKYYAEILIVSVSTSIKLHVHVDVAHSSSRMS